MPLGISIICQQASSSKYHLSPLSTMSTVTVGPNKVKGLITPSSSKTAVLMVCGAGGGVHGPGNMYYPLAKDFKKGNVTALQLDYRRPNYMNDCVQDVFDGIDYLKSKYDVNKVVLVGWSFGGAVVITAGALSESVVGVATVASQTYGTDLVGSISPRSLLLLHGGGDTCLSPKCSQQLYANAKQPKDIVIYDNDNHGLTNCNDQARERIYTFAMKLFSEDNQKPNTTTPQ